MNSQKLFVFGLLLILASSILVIAAGTSDSASSNSNNEVKNRTNVENKTNNETSRYMERAEIINGLIRAINASQQRSDRAKFILAKLYECDQVDNRTERIQCRLEIHKIARNHSVNEDVEDDVYRNETRLPEVCKKLKDRDECRKLYRGVHYCYDFNDSREKDRCFKRVAGFVNSNIKDEDNDREEKARKYLVFLLYELQERIENKVSSGELDAATGANLIEQITELKEDIMNKESRSVIKPKLQDFRKDYLEAMRE